MIKSKNNLLWPLFCQVIVLYQDKGPFTYREVTGCVSIGQQWLIDVITFTGDMFTI